MSDIPLELLSHREAAEYLRVSQRQVNRFVERKLLEKIKLGRLSMFALEDLRRFVADCRAPKEGQ